MKNKEILIEFRDLLGRGDGHAVREFCEHMHPAAVAELTAELKIKETKRLFAAMSPRQRAEVFSHLNEQMQVALTELVDPSMGVADRRAGLR